MNISRKKRYILSLLIPLGMLSSCSHRRRTATELRKHGNNQIGAGSALAVVSAGGAAAAIGIPLSTHTATGMVNMIIPLLAIIPATCLMIPVAGVLIAKGIKNRKKAKKQLLLEQQKASELEQVVASTPKEQALIA